MQVLGLSLGSKVGSLHANSHLVVRATNVGDGLDVDVGVWVAQTKLYAVVLAVVVRDVSHFRDDSQGFAGISGVGNVGLGVQDDFAIVKHDFSVDFDFLSQSWHAESDISTDVLSSGHGGFDSNLLSLISVSIPLEGGISGLRSTVVNQRSCEFQGSRGESKLERSIIDDLVASAVVSEGHVIVDLVVMTRVPENFASAAQFVGVHLLGVRHSHFARSFFEGDIKSSVDVVRGGFVGFGSHKTGVAAHGILVPVGKEIKIIDPLAVKSIALGCLNVTE